MADSRPSSDTRDGQTATELVGHYAPCGLSEQMHHKPVILKKKQQRESSAAFFSIMGIANYSALKVKRWNATTVRSLLAAFK